MLRNRVYPDINPLHVDLLIAINRIRNRPALVRSFFHAAQQAL